MRKLAKEITVFVHPATGRRYIDSADVADICGFDRLTMELKFRPSHWGAPRDFFWDGRRIWFAEASLGQLGDSLDARGGYDAAILLREWLVAHLASVAASTSPAVAPAPASAEKKSWANKWEEQHE